MTLAVPRHHCRAKWTLTISRAVDMCFRVALLLQDKQSPHDMDDYDEAVLFTYSLLETRLARLEYLLSGPKPQHEGRPQTIPERIHAIEQSLQQLAGKTALLDNVNELCTSPKSPATQMPLLTLPIVTKHKDVLIPTSSTTASPPLSISQKSALVVERAPAFATTASQLTSLSDSTIPSTDGFVKLAQLRPRIAEAETRQLQQALKIAELRRRSGLLVQRDKQTLGVGGGRAWAGCQERLVGAYRKLQREEGKRAEMGGEGEE